MRSPSHRIAFDEWHQSGLDGLLIDPPLEELADMLTASADQIAEFLRRGMRSTARTRIDEYRNLAESIASHFPAAADFRTEGYSLVRSSTLSNAMIWYSQIPSSSNQAYASLGITDAVFP